MEFSTPNDRFTNFSGKGMIVDRIYRFVKGETMIQILKDVSKYLPFIEEMCKEIRYSDPMLKTEEQFRNLMNSSNKKNKKIIGIFDRNEIIGFFVFLILDDDRYIEMLIGLSKKSEAYEEMIAFLKSNYRGYHVDFVYNPENDLLFAKLRELHAEFDIEQQKMKLTDSIEFQSEHEVIPYEDRYEKQYCEIHSKDRYWTAEKVIRAQDTFRILLSVENDQVIGYIDITYRLEENEPFDLFVREEYRRKGYGKALLAKAIELNRPKGMSLSVDTDNAAGIALYHSMGFTKVDGGNSIVGSVRL